MITCKSFVKHMQEIAKELNKVEGYNKYLTDEDDLKALYSWIEYNDFDSLTKDDVYFDMTDREYIQDLFWEYAANLEFYSFESLAYEFDLDVDRVAANVYTLLEHKGYVITDTTTGVVFLKI